MTLTYVLMQNLKRNPLRTGLTALAFALPMAIFVAAISLVAALIQFGMMTQQELRLGIHHKTTLINLLPAGYRQKIEALDPNKDRLRAVCGMRWFGGRVPDQQRTLTSLAADPDTFPIVYSDVKMTDGETEAWSRDRQACIVGIGIAERNRWKVGDRVTLKSTVPPYLPLEFRIVKVMQNVERGNFFYFRRDYLTESLKSAGVEGDACHIFWVKCKTANGLHALQQEIDSVFANSPDPTKAEDENAFAANFTKAAGDIPGLMRVIAIVVVVVITLVGGNTMMFSFRERTRELAVFKAIGFQSRRIFSIVLAESVALALLGALAGIIPTCLVLVYAPIRTLNLGPISGIVLSPAAVIGSLVISLVVGVAAGLWPAYQAMRLRPVEALRHGG